MLTNKNIRTDNNVRLVGKLTYMQFHGILSHGPNLLGSKSLLKLDGGEVPLFSTQRSVSLKYEPISQ